MSGKLIFKTREGRSKDIRYFSYLEWYMEVEGEDGVVTRLSPTFPEFAEFIRKVLLHEHYNDATRKRKDELAVKHKLLLGELSQMTIDMANIPEKYYKANEERIPLTEQDVKELIAKQIAWMELSEDEREKILEEARG